MSRHQTTDKNRYVNAVYKYFENVAKFKYLWTTVTNQNGIHGEIKNGLISGNATVQFRVFCLLVCYLNT
jgi:hypothetical protein